MAAAASNLNNPRYGYDFVVATTQDSINATMKKYLDSLDDSDTYIIFVRNAKKETVQISLDELKKASKGVDPFTLPADEDTTGENILALQKARFIAGIKVTLGLPQNYDDPRTLPPIIDLTQGAGSVGYNMLCADIKICQLAFTLDGPEWTTLSQNDEPNRAWIFRSHVDLMLDSAKFDKLPQNVKDGIKNLDGAMFDVQQLLFDLNNAGLQTVPSVDGLDSASDANVFLTKYFVNAYFGHMQAQGQPVLNYTVRHKPQNATMKPTDLNFHVSPLVGQLDPGLRTLNYLCATDGHKLPPAVDFTWDWLNGQDATQFNGIISINRDTFANYLMGQVYPIAKADCFIPYSKAYPDGLSIKFDAYPNGTPDDSQITHVVNPNGDKVISISYSAESWDYAGLDGALGHTGLKQTYTKDVTVSGNTVTIVTHMVVLLSIKVLQTKNEANITDKTITDKFELAVDQFGQLTTNYTTDTQDNSKSDSANWFSDLFTGVNDIFDGLKSRDFKTQNLQGHPIEAFQNFMFPGGDTFAFKQFRFSQYQDLLAAITYADPSQ